MGDYEDYDDEGLDEDELDDLMEEDGVKDELWFADQSALAIKFHRPEIFSIPFSSLLFSVTNSISRFTAPDLKRAHHVGIL